MCVLLWSGLLQHTSHTVKRHIFLSEVAEHACTKAAKLIDRVCESLRS